MVERRQKLVMNTAARTNAVVKSLFPENVRGRLIEEAGMSIDKAHFLNRDETHEERSAKPIADFFPVRYSNCMMHSSDNCSPRNLTYPAGRVGLPHSGNNNHVRRVSHEPIASLYGLARI